MKSTFAKVGATSAALLAVAAVAVAGSVSANADPVPTNQVFAAAGSDTIQDLYNAFANGYYNASGVFVAPVAANVASYDAFATDANAAKIQTKVGGPSFTRPSGSGAGRQALSASWDPANAIFSTSNLQLGVGPQASTTIHSVDIARSSGQPSAANLVTAGATNDNLTSIPLARDAVDVAFNGTAFTNLSTQDLIAIYSCTSNNDTTGGGHNVAVSMAGVVTVDGTTIHPKLPQSTSGTRQFFLAALGLGTGTASCVSTTSVHTGTTDSLHENDATELATAGDLAPFSAAQYIAQFNKIVADTGVSTIKPLSLDGRVGVNISGTTASANSGLTSLYGAVGTAIGAQSAPATGADAVFARDVYSVVPTAQLASNTALSTLVGTTAGFGTLHNTAAQAAITAFGFRNITFTGNFLHSKFEH